MDILKTIFYNININNWKLVINTIKTKKKDIDFNIPINNIYLLELLLINNKIDILKELKDINIFINIFDLDNNPIIFIPVKYNFYDMLKLLLEYNKKNIGISLLDLKNNNGLTILLYSLKLNNDNIIKLILEHNNHNYDVQDNNQYTPFHYIAKYSDINICKLFSFSNEYINKQNIYGETCLHIAINYNNDEVAKYIIDNKININIKDYKYELSAVHYMIINNKIDLLRSIKNIDYNTQDYRGRTYIHYFIIYNKQDLLLNILNNNNINYNICNIKGLTPLHMILQSNKFKNSDEILRKMIQNTNLNLQDNNGNTCLYYLIKNDIWLEYKEELYKKKLDIFIYNLEDIQIINIVKKEYYEQFINIIIKSFYNILKKKNVEFEEYLNYCKVDNSHSEFKKKYPEIYDKIIKINKKINTNDICYEIIKYYIIEKKISIPEHKNKLCINIEKPIKLAFVPYTGSNLDILCGLYYLEYNFKNVKTSLTKNFIINKKLENYYKTIGKNIYSENGSDFYNLEIIWDKQKLILPDNIVEIIKNLKKRFLVIPIGIEIDIGYHSNILIYDSKLKLIERFEPNGSNSPYGYYYNSSKLDELLKYKLKKYINEFNYISPKQYLPKIGLQIYENLEEKKKKIGDPGGYCSSWSLWYTNMVLSYPDIVRKKLIIKLIYTIKKKQISFKDNIRAFTNKIIIIRDSLLKGTDIDINDWLNNNYTKKQYDLLIQNILTNFNL